MLVRHDAISYSLRLKLDLLRRLRTAGHPVEVTAFVQATDTNAPDAPDVIVTPSVTELARNPRFRDADVHLYEFGMYYELFDSVFLLDDPSRVAAAYHNITPLELVTDQSVRPAIERSLVQKHNLSVVGHIACQSAFNLRDLVDFGIPAERLSVLHLPSARQALPRATHTSDDPIELLYVGRMVRAKGVLDLLDVTRRLGRTWSHPVRVSLVGSRTFSEPDVLAALASNGHDDGIRFLGDIYDDALARLMSRTDVVVIPSYHEGYCLPVIEAYQAGCQVIAYDAGNLPNVVGGLGQLVAAGDLDGLGRAINRAVDAVEARRHGNPRAPIPTMSGDMDVDEWRKALHRHLEDYSAERYDRDVLALLGRALNGPTSSEPLIGASR